MTTIKKAMAKPVILTVDDDPEVLQAVARDLRQEFGVADVTKTRKTSPSKSTVKCRLRPGNSCFGIRLRDGCYAYRHNQAASGDTRNKFSHCLNLGLVSSSFIVMRFN